MGTDVFECYKDHGPMTDARRISTGVWHILIAFIGIYGNMTTLIAIPYAAKKKRHGIHNDYSTTTVFLLYLSFVDLLHCVLMAIPRGIMYLNVIFWLMAFFIIAVRYDKKLSDAWTPMSSKEYIAYSIFANIFEVQYALNFFVYIFRSPQYRSAFFDIFKMLSNVPFNFRPSSISDTRRTNS